MEQDNFVNSCSNDHPNDYEPDPEEILVTESDTEHCIDEIVSWIKKQLLISSTMVGMLSSSYSYLF